MQRQITLQTGRLARATLASAGSWGPRSTASAFAIAVADTFAVSSSCCAVGGLPNAAAAAAAAWPRSLRAWSSQLQLQGDALPVAAQQSSTQRQLEQRRGMASAQAEPSTGGSEAVGTAPGSLSISDAAVQRLKELQAQVGRLVELPAGVWLACLKEHHTAPARPVEACGCSEGQPPLITRVGGAQRGRRPRSTQSVMCLLHTNCRPATPANASPGSCSRGPPWRCA